MMTEPKRPYRESAAIAWELEGALGLPFVVRENDDIAVEPAALAAWWERNRNIVMDVFHEHNPSWKGS